MILHTAVAQAVRLSLRALATFVNLCDTCAPGHVAHLGNLVQPSTFQGREAKVEAMDFNDYVAFGAAGGESDGVGGNDLNCSLAAFWEAAHVDMVFAAVRAAVREEAEKARKRLEEHEEDEEQPAEAPTLQAMLDEGFNGKPRTDSNSPHRTCTETGQSSLANRRCRRCRRCPKCHRCRCRSRCPEAEALRFKALLAWSMPSSDRGPAKKGEIQQ
eukprot:s92_g40.t1